MPKLIWCDNFSVKIAEIDAQHKKLIDMVNELSDAMAVGKGADALGDILSRLVQYTQTHFATEERLLKLYGYPNYDEHCAQHYNLTRQVLEIQDHYLTTHLGLTIPVLDFLNEWLAKHILQSDKEYAPFLTAKGLK